MIPEGITSADVKLAISQIDRDGVPRNRRATKYELIYRRKPYPPKYVLSLACKIATGVELQSKDFGGGKEANDFFSKLGFKIQDCSKPVQSVKTSLSKTMPGKLSICAALIQTQLSQKKWDKIPYSAKIEELNLVVSNLPAGTDVLVLPAGYFNSGSISPSQLIRQVSLSLQKAINLKAPYLTICTGIDGRNRYDQLAVAIDKTGIIAKARKFHHVDNEIKLANSPFDMETGYKRYFDVKGNRIYLAVCYDIFGISQQKLPNELNCNIIVNMIHGFTNPGGGAVDFARKGLAGAAQQWNVEVFGAATFFENKEPRYWPAGIKKIPEKISVKQLAYKDIAKKTGKSLVVQTSLGVVFLRQLGLKKSIVCTMVAHKAGPNSNCRYKVR